MSRNYGIEAPRPGKASERPAARYVVVIESASVGGKLARQFLASRESVADFNASAPEVLLMTQGLVARIGASGVEWDQALAGHSDQERATAEVYKLDA